MSGVGSEGWALELFLSCWPFLKPLLGLGQGLSVTQGFAEPWAIS